MALVVAGKTQVQMTTPVLPKMNCSFIFVIYFVILLSVVSDAYEKKIGIKVSVLQPRVCLYFLKMIDFKK